LLKLAMTRTSTIIEDLDPDWTDGIKLLNELAVKAPIASTLCNKECRTVQVQDGASNRANTGGNGHGDNNRSPRPSCFP
jgi:hypothetical protein